MADSGVMTDFDRNAEDDRLLLRAYAEGGSKAEGAFRALVERYSGLVHGTVMRALGNAEWAADATQNVFSALAAKAQVLVAKGIPSVGAWLHRAATFEARRVRRDQVKQQQRQTMIREELRASHEEAEEVHWGVVRPRLDEAMERLSGRDRDILLLHHVDGLTFKDIARRLGMGAAAAQKRGVRALEKLARLLKTKRGAVSATALGAFLGTELTGAAPVALITRIGATVGTTSAGSLMSSSATTALLTTMTTTGKTITTSIVAIAILCGTMGAGYLIGDASRPEGAERNSSGVSADEAVTSGGRRSNGRLESDDRRENGTRAQEFLRYFQGLLERRAAIIQEARQAQADGASPGELSKLLERMEDLMKGAEGEMESLAKSDFAELVGLLSAKGEEEKQLGTILVLGAWGKIDPVGALEFARAEVPDNQYDVFSGWAAVDPQAALKEQKRMVAEDRSKGRFALMKIYQGWLSSDPAGMVASYKDLPFDDQKTVARVFKRGVKQESVRGVMVAEIAKLSDERLRAELMGEVGAEWAELAIEPVFEWFDSVEFENPRQALVAANRIFGSAVRRGDTAKCVRWVWPKLPDDQRGPFIERAVRQTWMKKDPEGAAAWLKEEGIDFEEESR